MIHIAWACGWLAMFGLFGFVKAADVEKQVAPLEQKVNEQNVLLQRMSKTLTDSLASGIASDIRAKIAKRCNEPSQWERERLNREIDKLQDQYAEYKNGARFREPTCGEL